MAVALLSGGAEADPVADFYENKTVVIVSAGQAGGAHGLYTQIIANHIKKHIPGNPTVVIKHMAGAGGNLAMNYLYNVAPKDGTHIGVPLQDLIFNARIGVAAVKYDATKAHYLGGVDVTRTTISVMKVAGVSTIEEAKHKDVLMGASGKSGSQYTAPVVLNSLLGTKFKIVLGYDGIASVHLAMARGEVHGSAASWAAIADTKADWVEKGLIANLMTVALEREPRLPDVPAITEMLSAADDLALTRLLAGSDALGRAWVAMGDIPADRLAALRAAYAATMADPAFKAEIAQRKMWMEPIAWQKQQALAQQILATPDATVARLKTMLGLD
jgi:tripartite-type tricarboxylate transporter receptor subunit TctC